MDIYTNYLGSFCVCSILLAPNTYDSMSYHMTRVVHWMQNNSVSYYLTGIDRQNIFPPGAEYLILFFQIIMGTDYLAGLVQLFSFLLLVPSVDVLLKLFRITKKWRTPLTVFAIASSIFFYRDQQLKMIY